MKNLYLLLSLAVLGVSASGCYAPSTCQTYCERAVAGGCGDTCLTTCENQRRIALGTNCDESLSRAIDCSEENACMPSACAGYYALFEQCVDIRCVAHPSQPECAPL